MALQQHFSKNSVAPPLEVPGGVYLCQVNEKVSCGACCGLYNVADTSKTTLTAVLKHRSDQFRSTPRTVAAIDDFVRMVQKIESQQRPFPQFHHCPFIGLIGEGEQRVGCLLHPLGQGNDGVDFRGLSYYGGLACRTYFCPSTHTLPARFKRILCTCMEDWYAYGLIVTESALLRALFHSLEAMLGRPLVPTLFEKNPQAGQRLSELLRLKIDWPHRPPDADTPCHHFFLDASYDKPAIDYTALGAPVSIFDEILVELVSGFHKPEELTDAETRIEMALVSVVAALESSI